MQENQNISFIEELDTSDNPTVNNNVNNITKVVQTENTQNGYTNVINQSEDYIKELPSWDINPPLEINRGEK